MNAVADPLSLGLSMTEKKQKGHRTQQKDKKGHTVRLDADLIEPLTKFSETQLVPPGIGAVVNAAVRAFLRANASTSRPGSPT